MDCHNLAWLQLAHTFKHVVLAIAVPISEEGSQSVRTDPGTEALHPKEKLGFRGEEENILVRPDIQWLDTRAVTR